MEQMFYDGRAYEFRNTAQGRESMACLCREFGISRKTRYKIFARYEECGLEGLSERTRRPFRYANQLPEQVEAAIGAAKRERPTGMRGKSASGC